VPASSGTATCACAICRETSSPVTNTFRLQVQAKVPVQMWQG
jgi:hypothetical protein